MSFLEKLASFFLIAQPDPEDPFENPKTGDDTAGIPSAPTVEILKPEDIQPSAEKKPAQPELKAERDSETETGAEDRKQPEPRHAQTVRTERTESPASPAGKRRGEARKRIEDAIRAEAERTGAEAEQPEPAAEKPAEALPEPQKKAEARPAEQKPAESRSAKKQLSDTQQLPASQIPAAEPSADEAREEHADEERSFADKVRAFFFPGDEDGDADIQMPGARDGRRPMGTKVRMASHRFTTVTDQAKKTEPDCLPLDDSARALLEAAKAVRQNAYAKYSGFRVGAALKAASGQVYFGVNVENSSYPAGICAERSAFTAAVTAGERQFTAIAIAGGDDSMPCFPCGICRQTLMELCRPDMPVILESGIYRLDSLLPHAFHLTNR